MLGDGFATIQALYDFLKSTIQKKKEAAAHQKSMYASIKTSWAQK